MSPVHLWERGRGYRCEPIGKVRAPCIVASISLLSLLEDQTYHGALQTASFCSRSLSSLPHRALSSRANTLQLPKAIAIEACESTSSFCGPDVLSRPSRSCFKPETVRQVRRNEIGNFIVALSRQETAQTTNIRSDVMSVVISWVYGTLTRILARGAFVAANTTFRWISLRCAAAALVLVFEMSGAVLPRQLQQ